MSGERKWARRMNRAVFLAVLIVCLGVWLLPTKDTVTSNADPYIVAAEMQDEHHATTTTAPVRKPAQSHRPIVVVIDGVVHTYPMSPLLAMLIHYLDRNPS